uniref:Protein kinase domain-containing protein n=1 Tax=Panagrolaimus sp. ES5 TaxID=591445 RepID=A0AC34F0E3_9BILA
MGEVIKTLERKNCKIDEIAFNIAKWNELKNHYGTTRTIDPSQPLIGGTFHNFTVLAELGSGNSIAYAAKLEGLLVALKWSNRERIDLESEFVISTDCWRKEKLLQIFQFVQCNGYQFLTGKSLYDFLLSSDETMKDICHYMSKALEPLEVLHGLGLLHGDVKVSPTFF